MERDESWKYVTFDPLSLPHSAVLCGLSISTAAHHELPFPEGLAGASSGISAFSIQQSPPPTIRSHFTAGFLKEPSSDVTLNSHGASKASSTHRCPSPWATTPTTAHRGQALYVVQVAVVRLAFVIPHSLSLHQPLPTPARQIKTEGPWALGLSNRLDHTLLLLCSCLLWWPQRWLWLYTMDPVVLGGMHVARGFSCYGCSKDALRVVACLSCITHFYMLLCSLVMSEAYSRLDSFNRAFYGV